MKGKAGQPEKYATAVKPYLGKIAEWVAGGATVEQIAKNLGIAPSSFYVYKNKYPELAEAFKNKAPLVDNLRGALVKKALGFTYTEKTESTRVDPETGKKVKFVQIVTKEALPDATAIFGALNIYDPDYVKDRKDYELKKKIAESSGVFSEGGDRIVVVNSVPKEER